MMCPATADDTITYLHCFMKIYELSTLDKLNKAFRECSRISSWKESVQRYKMNLIVNNLQLQEDLRNGTYVVSPTTDFDLNERGKLRHIEAPSIRDRIAQKVLCQEILIPQLTKPLIYDNYASLKNRGTSFARKRICVLLQRFLRKHNNGYVLQIDIKSYFDSVDHTVLKQMIHKRLNESEEVMDLIDYIIDTSSESDKGLNLGSEAPQIFAIYYLSPVDSYIKTVKGVKYYGRYMDDMFIFGESKEELKQLLNGIKNELSKLHLEVNEKKTHIVKLSHGFTFMQIKYNVDNGRVTKRLTRKKIVRERRRLKKHKKLLDKNIVDIGYIQNCYLSWRNNVIKEHNACKHTIISLDTLFKKLFEIIPKKRKQTREDILKEAFRDNRQYAEMILNY